MAKTKHYYKSKKGYDFLVVDAKIDELTNFKEITEEEYQSSLVKLENSKVGGKK